MNNTNTNKKTMKTLTIGGTTYEIVDDQARKNKVDKTQAEITGSLSMGRKAGTKAGTNSTALGIDVTAATAASYAEGAYTRVGCKAFTIMGIQKDSAGTGGKYFLDSVDGLQVGDVYSVHIYYSNDTSSQAENHGKITAIDTTAKSVAVDNFYTVDERTFATKTSYIDDGLDNEQNSFRIVSKPEVGNRILGYAAHAEGKGNKAYLKASHAEGQENISYGSYAHTEGTKNSAGYCAHAEGAENTASGFWSHAEGKGNSSSGNLAHAEGAGTTASGRGSHTEGNQTEASGDYGHAEGGKTKALAAAAHAEGLSAEATGKYSHAEGNSTKATGIQSHAQGHKSVASSENAHAEGYFSQAKGKNSHAEGQESKTAEAAQASHAEGANTEANGSAAHAEGKSTIANGYASHTEGQSTIANCKHQHVQGKYNLADDPSVNDGCGNYAHIVGGGTSTSVRKNIHTVDWNGNAWFAGKLSQNGVPENDKDLATVELVDQCAYAPRKITEAPISGSMFVVNSTEVLSRGSAIYVINEELVSVGYYKCKYGSEGNGDDVWSLNDVTYWSAGTQLLIHVIGLGTTTRVYVYFLNESNNIFDDYYVLYVDDNTNVWNYKRFLPADRSYVANKLSDKANVKDVDNSLSLKVDKSNAEITGSLSLGRNSNTKAGTYSVALGKNVAASGETSMAHGINTSAPGKGSHAEGTAATLVNESVANSSIANIEKVWRNNAYNFSIAKGIASHSEGGNCIALGDRSHVEGNITFANGNNAHAEGFQTQAFGHCSHVEGWRNKVGTKVNDQNYGFAGHAEGRETIVSANYAHAEGRSSTASGTASHAEGSESLASNSCAHAEGYHSVAQGDSSHAEGNYSTASGSWSHAQGFHVEAGASCAHAEGTYTKAMSQYQHVQGKFNEVDTENKYAHIVGNGSPSTDADPENRSNAHTLDWNGNAWYQGSVTSNGADYAEFFEWVDGNPDSEDRVGMLVTLDGEKMKLANSGDEILGIISGTAAVLGDNYECDWNGKYLTDDFGRILYDEVEEFVETPKTTISEIVNEETGEVEISETTEMETRSLGIFKHPRINPDYDPEQVYVNRANRPEWDTVGMVGKLYLRDDGTCEVNSYATVGVDGVATASAEKTNIRVLTRVNENVVRVLLK